MLGQLQPRRDRNETISVRDRDETETLVFRISRDENETEPITFETENTAVTVLKRDIS